MSTSYAEIQDQDYDFDLGFLDGYVETKLAQGCSAYDPSKKDYAAKTTGTQDASMLTEQLRTKAYEAPTRGSYPVSAGSATTPAEPKLVLPASNEVIVGGGFSPKGAHNISEALALGKPVVVGPHIHTIEYPAAEAAAAGVCRVLEGPEALVAHVDSGAVRPGVAEIERFFAAHSGATERCLAAVVRWLA